MRNDVYSKRIRAGKRRTYFFDVRTTKGSDYYLTITESKKRFHDDGYDRHKIFVYKEDFNKFLAALEGVVNHIKDNLLPEYDFDEFTREPEDITNEGSQGSDFDYDDGRSAEDGMLLDNVDTETSAEVNSNVEGTDEEEEAMDWD